MVLILIRSTHLSSHTKYSLCNNISIASLIFSAEMMVSLELCTTPSRYHGSSFSNSWMTTSRVSEMQQSSMVETIIQSSMRHIAGRAGHSEIRDSFLEMISRILWTKISFHISSPFAVLTEIITRFATRSGRFSIYSQFSEPRRSLWTLEDLWRPPPWHGKWRRK